MEFTLNQLICSNIPNAHTIGESQLATLADR